MANETPDDAAEGWATRARRRLWAALVWEFNLFLWPFRIVGSLLGRGGPLSLVGFFASPVGVYLLAGPGWAVLTFALSCVLADALVIGDSNDEDST